jgi:Ca-activated chloride channel family protein
MRRLAFHNLFFFSFICLIISPWVVLSRERDSLARPDALQGTEQNLGVQQSNQVAPFAIRSNVNLVVVRASVRDHKGAPISGLTKENFQVYEDKVLQQIESFSHEDVPVTIGLVIDNSGSMRPKRADVITAAMAFVRSSNPADQIFVVNFNEHVSMGLPASVPFTNNATQVEAALSRHAITGMTALYDAITAALQQLQKGKWDKKVLIVVSDGGDNASKSNLAQVISMVNQSNALIYTLGIFDESDEDRNPRVLKQLSRASGGEAFFPKTLQEILPICEQIAHDIRGQYTISFVPINKKQDGAYRAINVKAREASGGRRLSVSTRAGYIAPANLHSSDNNQSIRP